jgi:methionyl-tRNA formyltransferase
MVRALQELERGALACRPQREEDATYAEKLDPAETRIDWRQSAREVHDLIRGLSPQPGAWFEIELGGRSERIKALRSVLAERSGRPGMILDDRLTVACGEGAVRLIEVQRAGKKPMSADSFLRGATIPTGSALPGH